MTIEKKNEVTRQKNQSYRRYNILPTLNKMGTGNIRKLIPLLEIATEQELRALKQIVNSIESRMLNAERKAKQPWRRF